MKFLSSVLLRSVLFSLLGAALFAGCCGSVACNCQNYRADALLFNFKPGSFTAAQIDTVLLVRSVYPRDSVIRTGTGSTATVTYAKGDTATIVRERTTVFTNPIVLDNAEPFATVNGRKLGDSTAAKSYRYTILVREPARRGPVLARYYIGRVQLRGQYEADGCCSCYRNEDKQFTLSSFANGSRRDTLVDAHVAPGAEPRVTILRR
ncbi:hypothetical protein [Hymenobacter edaphi]|uniref:Lipoprotein n=1 Tax=Hymenobacter edaphi TaxID=2211146 RepID=A0A328BF28_9BACT|nr:hypothetical protein [Hymenobacter edaphi]RAK65972.1 hypothetical protein DLM85_14785 [Hymenobacter edaphi]